MSSTNASAAEQQSDDTLLRRRVAELEAQLEECTLNEAILRERESRYQRIIETATAGLWLIDAADVTVSVSPSLAALLGYRVEEMTGRPLQSFVVAGATDMPDTATLRHRQGLVERRDFPFQRKDGSALWATVTVSPVYDPAGQYMGALAMVSDTTLFKQAQAALDASEERYRRLVAAYAAEQARLETLHADLRQALTVQAPLRESLQDCAEAIVRCLGVPFARIWTLDAAGEMLELQASAGMYTHLDGPHSRVPVGLLKIGHIAALRKPQYTEDIPNDLRFDNREWARREGLIAFAGYPLLAEDRLFGVLALFDRTPLSMAVRNALAVVADKIALHLEQRRSNAELLSGAAQLSSILSDAALILFALDAQGVFTLSEGGGLAALNLAPGELVGQSAFAVYRDQPQIEVDIRRALAGAALTAIHKLNGNVYETRYSPHYDEQGALKGVIGVSVDITEKERLVQEQSRLLAELRHETADLRTFYALAENAPDGILVMDRQGGINYANPALHTLVGAADLTGMNIRDLLSADEQALTDTELRLPERRLWQGVLTFRRRDGSTFPAHISTFVLGNGTSEEWFVPAVVRDITGQQRAEQERIALQEQVIAAQQAALRELSTPLIPLAAGVVAMPLIGGIDSARAQQVIATLLAGIEANQAATAIVDITGVPVVDSQVAQVLIQAAQAVQLLGAQVVLTGIRPEVAQTLIGLGLNIDGVVTRSSLQSGIAYALRRR